MIHTDRERLFLAVGVALVFHAVLFGGLALAGFDFTPYPETSPVTVTLPDYTPPEVERQIEPEPVEPEPVEPEPPPARIAPAEPELAPAEPAPAEPAPEPAPPARDAGPVPAPRASSEPPASGTDAPPGAFSQDDLRWLNDDDVPDREGDRTPDDLFAIDEPDEVDTDLPSWVVEGEFSLQPESSLERGEQRALEQMRETVPGFADRLAELVEALENPPGAADFDGEGGEDAPGEADGSDGGVDDGPSTPSSTTEVPGGAIEWVGSGSRRPVGELTRPDLTASDFGGTVPARVSYLIVFEVDEDGLVVPGSLILRQSSGYTLADQKVRRAVSTWRFDQAPGTRPVTAIATLHIARDEIRR